ncbi:MAG: LLM class F420-dependent oxidoreductase [Deltaproteobacteria bacterium]|nr:LLM class F420-dependent oxidoreductase [Deltaproteobacteria bacterium]MBW2445578.1 LLM class F420-dependent oxidoreductase [Deltaproteobacteria bacterium]
MRFSVQLPTDRVEAFDEFGTAEAITEVARAVEAAGFDAGFVTDHPFPSDRFIQDAGGHHALDPFVALSFVAAATTRLKLQTHILVLPYRNPFHTASAVASLDAVSGGRVIMGVAAGYLKDEFEALGADYENRNAFCDEALRAIRAAWTEDGVQFEGSGYRANGHTLEPKPVQKPHPPIWVGGNSKMAIRRAVELGDGWLPIPAPKKMASFISTASIEDLDDLRDRMAYARAHAEKIGRTKPLDICFVPFGLSMKSQDDLDPAVFRSRIAELEEIGVTWVTLTLPARTRAEFCDRVASFGAALRP